MNLKLNLLLATLLFATTTAVLADDSSANTKVVPLDTAEASQGVADEALSTPAVDCEAQETPFASNVFDDNGRVETIRPCGPCSVPQCDGATRGQLCNYGGGWGNCNIFSGGTLCPEGGWDCQCSGGYLP